MCGRFTLRAKLNQLLQQFACETTELDGLSPRYNAAPTQDIAVVRNNDQGSRELALLRWGLIPSWAKDINVGPRAPAHSTQAL